MNINRRIKSELDSLIDKYPILVLTGPRQSGKTTFLRNEFPNYKYVSLENLDSRKFAKEDPNGFLKHYDKYVVFDEVQRVPQLFSYLQTKVDEDKIMGQYILSGSQNFQLMQNITQSLAGRVALFKLFPLDFEEMKSANLLELDYAINLYKGFDPAIFDRKIPSNAFYSNYLQTYVERDLSELINIRDLKIFRKFLLLCSARAGQLLNLNSLANDCGISQPTAKSWISVLESSYILFQLQPYHTNYNKRVTKSSKLFFYDTGLLCHLLKIKNAENVKTCSFKGSLFENFIIAEFMKNNYHKNLLRDLWFWRDALGNEVDLIWQSEERINIVEIKSSETIVSEMFKGLSFFENNVKTEILSKTVIHTGSNIQVRNLGIAQSWISISE
jgi:uncharacterized protein